MIEWVASLFVVVSDTVDAECVIQEYTLVIR